MSDNQSEIHRLLDVIKEQSEEIARLKEIIRKNQMSERDDMEPIAFAHWRNE